MRHREYDAARRLLDGRGDLEEPQAQRVELHAAESHGVDISESMLGAARAKCRNTQFVCADLTNSDAEPGPFDLITSFRFFGNAQDELRTAVLTAIRLMTVP